METQAYFFDQAADEERSRLHGIEAVFDPLTVRHLVAAGAGPGLRCLEVGAGAGGIAGWLARTVGPAGHVVATDVDTRLLDRVGAGVEVVRHDITTDPLDEGAFDLIHARAVLEHLPSREQVLDRLVAALRPGGVLVVEDFVFGGALTAAVEPATRPAPHGPPLTEAVQAVATGFRAIGADPEWGLRLPAAMEAAGLREVTAEMGSRWTAGGSPEAAFYAQTVSEVGPRLVAAGVLGQDVLGRVGPFLADPASRWFSLAMVSVSGRR